MLDVQGVTNSIEHVQLNTVSAQESKSDLEFFYGILEKNNPKTIGGKLPENSFYY